ncbi:insecticidal delta-endotoxin Cry8Ea1 family protein [Bacillus mycoides]|uniref:insecticidal delta-endotoxin Cry8Ea1 family protein n=1 Tax=Bacillus mycoides TaxID=1405 RepID=UPI00364F94CE
MNQNYKNNEYEILDNDNTVYQPRYPLAQAPDSELRNMNYKDWLAKFPDRAPVIPAESYNADLREAIITSINILTSLLSLTIPVAGVAGGIISAMLGWLWPTNTEAVWEAFMDAVEALVDQKIDDFARSQAIGKLRGIHDVLELYETAVSNLQKDPQNEALKETVRTQFIATNTFIVGSLPSLRPPGYEVPMLASYAQAVNLHLLLLRDAVKFGTSWGMESATVAGYQGDLETGILFHTDNCVKTYNKGIEKTKMLKANVKDYDRYPWAQYHDLLPSLGGTPEKDFQNVENWNLLNSFRRDMTIMALDLVSIWPTYNSKEYPLPVKAQLTREIYTDLRGCYAGDINSTEAQIIRPPHLFTFFKSATLYTGTPPIFPYVGIQQSGHYTLGPSFTTTVKGTSEGAPNTVTATPSDAIINKVDIDTGNELYRFMFYQENYTQPFKNVGENSSLGYVRTINRIPIEGNQTLANHRISSISGSLRPASSGGPMVGQIPPYISCAALGWTHISANLDNKIVSDKITQIPAVKGFGLGGNAKVIPGPGSTGGDLVQLPNPGYVKIAIPAARNTQSYRVRIRYASSQAGTLRVIKWRDGTYTHAFYNVPQTYSSLLTYGAFKYLESFAITPDTNIEVWLENSGGGPIIIDKIEFIPLTPMPDPELKVPVGTYQIITALNNSSVVDMMRNQSIRNVQIFGNGNGTNQKWNFVYDASKAAYQIKNIANENLVLTWSYDVERPFDVNATTNYYWNRQYWIIEDAGNGYVYLKNKEDLNIGLNVKNANTANGTLINAVSFNSGTSSQKFRMNRLN